MYNICLKFPKIPYCSRQVQNTKKSKPSQPVLWWMADTDEALPYLVIWFPYRDHVYKQPWDTFCNLSACADMQLKRSFSLITKNWTSYNDICQLKLMLNISMTSTKESQQIAWVFFFFPLTDTYYSFGVPSNHSSKIWLVLSLSEWIIFLFIIE